MVINPGIGIGGAEESRTPDPLRAKQVLSQLSYSPTRTQMINTNDRNYNYLSLGSSENANPTFLNKGDKSNTPGVPIAHASIQALIHSLIFGGN